MQPDFAGSLKRVLVSEGGKVDDPKDPGGRTAYGVTQRVFTAWLRNQGKPPRDVWTIAQDEVAAIYQLQYWGKIHGDDLPAGVDYVVFDGAVNSGPVQSAKWLQHALGMNSIDGVLGQATLAAVANDSDNDALIARYCASRLLFCKHLKTWSRFGHGWESRIDHVKQVGQQQASGSVGPEPVYFSGGEAKADIADAKSIPSTGPASAIVSGGTASAVLSQITSTLQPVAPMIPHLGDIITVATAVGGIAAIAGGGWLWLAKRQAAARSAALDLPSAAVSAQEPSA